ncbi:MAG: GNAT family N-acetyltransferase [Chloroflexi bacterium]|nr:GNAT family N-acetyltransferase [Chloroflexota bacterium]
MAQEIRPITGDELEAFSRCQSAAFGRSYQPEMLEYRRELFEFDRSLGAFDGGEITGTAGIFSFDMTVPGGAAVPTAGVTMVSVLPTHRRRGILSAMMRRQLEHVRERGEAFAALWASESVIYGRFGYGLAAESNRLSIDRERTALASKLPARGRVRMVTREEARSAWPAVLERVRPTQPGMMSRSEPWWNRSLRDHPDFRDGHTEAYHVSYEEDGATLGYVRYRYKQDWTEDHLPNHTVNVAELMASTDEAYVALWEYVLNLDLAGLIVAEYRRTDEPLYWMLADPRRLRRTPDDTLWLRILDVPAALAARAYAAPGRVVFEVGDDFCPWVAGRYELTAGPGGATCRPTGEPAGITLNAADLASAYLGGVRFETLSQAGRVTGDSAAISLATKMFATERAPWCPEMF